MAVITTIVAIMAVAMAVGWVVVLVWELLCLVVLRVVSVVQCSMMHSQMTNQKKLHLHKQPVHQLLTTQPQ
ncbi:hypothetical protein phiK7A1_029c [Pseudomonas phage phiK7A1]|uniref:Uncharacterized protein n=1 Tax=Pseudomonas phage phiK7A1 TaxID=2759194 RepID=A0A7H0XFM9_9CAUD|nr:hypothetical protein phiK7A1_029c [Pseudomonas phage phiK7A1]